MANDTRLPSQELTRLLVTPVRARLGTERRVMTQQGIAPTDVTPHGSISRH